MDDSKLIGKFIETQTSHASKTLRFDKRVITRILVLGICLAWPFFLLVSLAPPARNQQTPIRSPFDWAKNRVRSLPRNSCFLSGRGCDDLESQLGGFPFELLDL